MSGAEPGFSIRGPQLLDAHGNPFVMKGVNYPHAWFVDKLPVAIPAIAATGANTVRVVLSAGHQWARTDATQVASILAMLAAYKLIAVLEVHDATGFGEQPTAVPLAQAVDYWLSDDIRSVLTGTEARVLVNIANEPFGNNTSCETYVAEHKAAIARLRAGGYQHVLMVDGANWGQDHSHCMRDNAAGILQSDPSGKTMFSVHMYDVYDSEAKVDSYLRSFHDAGLPLVVGEFAADHGPGKPVAAEAILRLCKRYGQGYLGWSWIGNSPGLESLDIATAWDGSSLTPWGKLLVPFT